MISITTFITYSSLLGSSEAGIHSLNMTYSRQRSLVALVLPAYAGANEVPRRTLAIILFLSYLLH